MYTRTAYWALLCLCTIIQGIWCEPESRIANGKDAVIEQYPFMAFLQILANDGTTRNCSGAIINENNIVTAAHCIFKANSTRVRIGSTYSGGGGTEYKTKRMFKHPAYRAGDNDYDVGIVNIKEGMNLDGEMADSIPVENNGTIPKPGDYVIIAGWGAKKQGGPISEELQMGKIQVQNNTYCSDENEDFVRSRQFCAKGRKAASCTGDDGGPVIGSSNTLVGVTSAEYSCGKDGKPSYYTRASDSQIRSFINVYGGGA